MYKSYTSKKLYVLLKSQNWLLVTIKKSYLFLQGTPCLPTTLFTDYAALNNAKTSFTKFHSCVSLNGEKLSTPYCHTYLIQKRLSCMVYIAT